jgi:anti-anti-sigma factor
MAVGIPPESLHLLIAGLRMVVAEDSTASTIALEGEWDLAQQNKALVGFDHVLARHPQRLVLDLSRLTFMDSTGIHGVTELARRAAHLGVELAVVPGPRAVQRLFELCPLTEPMTFIDPG